MRIESVAVAGRNWVTRKFVDGSHVDSSILSVHPEYAKVAPLPIKILPVLKTPSIFVFVLSSKSFLRPSLSLIRKKCIGSKERGASRTPVSIPFFDTD